MAAPRGLKPDPYAALSFEVCNTSEEQVLKMGPTLGDWKSRVQGLAYGAVSSQ